ncbi:lycopene cyclase domain-containing protein [Mycobacterium avium subsp. hominissuis]|uniref:lycopene cyclase domain-containing protein n=1 Tax=Mycobacterium avium TaxID=1764 RepID=UPI00039247C6|nr:lycopene cyclase domain-containing protein [Mycobacterium avium]BAN32384.1 lycopene cyclase, CrtYc [Mycobacterium avium subsp. hominissuis TH135]
MSDRWQYLVVLTACLVVTAPLEIAGAGVYRRRRRLAAAVLPVAAVFLLWDEIAVAARVWTYDHAYLCGLSIPVRVPIEELLFFLIIPVCAVLTYNAVSTILDKVRRR